MIRCPFCNRELQPGEARCPNDGLVLTGADDPMIGATLAGRYRILGRIARGGMASVYAARHVLVERLCAIKLLRRDLCDDPVQRDRFLREARAVNRINHQNIVEIVDYGESEDGRIFLVMEYLPGESLQARLTRGPMDPAHALEVAIQIASGLARAHQMGVIHRDLKPDNILLMPAEDGRDLVKILDFGIAKMLDQPSLTAHDKIFGTPGYIAPEYAAGAPIDGRADLYSLGVVLYEMVTAALPFEAEYPGDLLLKHMLDPPIPPRERRPELPEVVEALVLRALAKDPALRFHDAHHMVQEMARVLGVLRGDSGTVQAPRPTMVPEPPVDESPTPVDGVDMPVLAPQPDVGAGVAGASAWARYLAALRAELDETYGQGPRPVGLEEHLARMDRLCGAMRDRIERVAQLKQRMLDLEARGRDFRTTIGRAIDALAAELSAKTRERDGIAQERERLEARRAELLARASGAKGATAREAAGAADAVLWELAAGEELLRSAVAACEDLEYQLRELGNQLERLSEALEADQTELVSDIDVAFYQLARDDEALRNLADALPRE